MMKPRDNKIERGQSRTRVKKHRTLRNTMEVKMSVGDGNTVHLIFLKLIYISLISQPKKGE